ncbi:MAG: hypothetical protein RMM29_07900, partial [Planctomycetota bacterium]|nr:hypothetical protein [Planctomycetota bacterium]
DCKIGNSNDLASWVPAPTPTQIGARSYAGTQQSTRVSLAWADGAIKNTWLRVEVKATARTGLAAPYVFYFGNTVGETGNSSTDAYVGATDQLRIRTNAIGINQAAITNVFDINRDRQVGALDVLLARQNVLPRERALRLITAP